MFGRHSKQRISSTRRSGFTPTIGASLDPHRLRFWLPVTARVTTAGQRLWGATKAGGSSNQPLDYEAPTDSERLPTLGRRH